MDMIIIQAAIKDSIGQAFWIQHFVEYVSPVRQYLLSALTERPIRVGCRQLE